MFKLALLLSSAALAGATPQGLLTVLLKTPVHDSELPSARFSHARTEKQPVSANGRRYHAVGLVDVALEGPDAEDAFAWVVFKSHKDALADLDNPAVGNGVNVVNVVPGIRDSLMLTSTIGPNKVTAAAAVVGNVLVQGVVAAPQVRQRTAILLLHAGIAHLRRVR
jgi:hypothetical protein